MTIIIGIDPGKHGGISSFFNDTAKAFKMPETVADLSALLCSIINDGQGFCYLEKVASSPQMGVKSSFTFGRGLGHIEGILAALLIPMEYVTPQKWQKAMQCMSGGDKNKTKAMAQQLFPALKITHSTADALLIGEYGRRCFVAMNGDG